ncbi:hypothetical protein LEN26_007655 [Aphanomyces euteiches]|uniref:C3HC-type domain-containing protein n=1 Tax=Aphanomyces euteiches TaxID=100861 RepID=A0A6G0X425_9STRA|nr:hypothetical protein Ae201684_008739 [Aphanomyces euteiches]KAH9085854.1 hypothetical protein Ae201684P_005552 [Aphanomyces euteiches]KAH9121844.1 hypothetical protein AeMF1_006603 [Aphanomyces euteiches]KAH9131549.1 hypothetical protein LEN26_007655 [Aphanomyces euteiches]KAH9138913.1 hypothetical protein AeRB84_016803 [Aphanomyces euteiches]
MNAGGSSTATLLTRVDEVLAGWKNVTAPVKKKTTDVLPPHMPPPKDVSTQCHPNNRKDFQARVATFTTMHWFAKPVELNLLTCARFGWINSGPDELTCKCCDQTLDCRIDPRLGSEGAQKVAEGLNAYLTSYHLDTCPWKHNPSPKSFTQVHFWTQEAALEAVLGSISNSYAKWASPSSSVALDTTFLDKLCEQWQVSKDDLKQISRQVAQKAVIDTSIDVVETKVDISALVSLAICGWQIIDGELGTFGCSSCNRVLRVISNNAQEPFQDEESTEPSTKRQKPSGQELCPLQEHRFCPWQRTTDDEMEYPGWVQCAKAIKHGILASLVPEDTQPSHSSPTAASYEPSSALAKVQALLDFS